MNKEETMNIEENNEYRRKQWIKKKSMNKEENKA